MHTPSRTLFRNGQVARLQPTEFALFLELRHAHRAYNSQDLADRLYSDRPDGGPINANKCIHAFVFCLRKKIKPLGLTIECAQGGDGTYQLIDSSVARPKPDRALILELRRQGATRAEIARKVQATWSMVNRILNAAVVSRPEN